MIDEKQLADYRTLFEKNQDSPMKFMHVEIQEMADTLEALWKLARSVRRWQKASPGHPSIEAEADMIKHLDALSG